MFDTKPFRHEFMLGPNIVVERDFRERLDIAVRRGDRFAISKESRYDDEIFLWIQSLVFTDQPDVVGYSFKALAS